MSSEARVALRGFLAEGYTHREIDLVLGQNPRRSKGWVSFGILTRRYGLRGDDRGALYLFGRQAANQVVSAIMKRSTREPLDRAVAQESVPAVLAPYRGTFALAKNAAALQRMLSGEARNGVQRFFDSRKKAASRCQMQGCRETRRLDTVHLLRTRPQMFARAAKAHGERDGQLVRYDVYEVMREFIRSHMGLHSVAFLCKAHHQVIDGLRESSRTEYRAFIKTLAAGFHAGGSA